MNVLPQYLLEELVARNNEPSLPTRIPSPKRKQGSIKKVASAVRPKYYHSDVLRKKVEKFSEQHPMEAKRSKIIAEEAPKPTQGLKLVEVEMPTEPPEGEKLQKVLTRYKSTKFLYLKDWSPTFTAVADKFSRELNKNLDENMITDPFKTFSTFVSLREHIEKGKSKGLMIPEIKTLTKFFENKNNMRISKNFDRTGKSQINASAVKTEGPKHDLNIASVILRKTDKISNGNDLIEHCEEILNDKPNTFFYNSMDEHFKNMERDDFVKGEKQFLVKKRTLKEAPPLAEDFRAIQDIKGMENMMGRAGLSLKTLKKYVKDEQIDNKETASLNQDPDFKAFKLRNLLKRIDKSLHKTPDIEGLISKENRKQRQKSIESYGGQLPLNTLNQKLIEKKSFFSTGSSNIFRRSVQRSESSSPSNENNPYLTRPRLRNMSDISQVNLNQEPLKLQESPSHEPINLKKNLKSLSTVNLPKDSQIQIPQNNQEFTEFLKKVHTTEKDIHHTKQIYDFKTLNLKEDEDFVLSNFKNSNMLKSLNEISNKELLERTEKSMKSKFRRGKNSKIIKRVLSQF